MAGTVKHKYPSDDQLVALMEQHGSITAVGAVLGIGEGTLHSHIRKRMLEGATDLRDRMNAARHLSTVKNARATAVPMPGKAGLEQLLREAPNLQAAADSLGCHRSTLVNACKRLGIETRRASDETEVRGDTAVLDSSELKNAERLMEERGFLPDEWRVDRATVNEWTGADGSDHRQLKVHLVRKPDLDWVFPAVIADPVCAKPRPRKATKTRPETWVLVGDHQAPLHSEPAHEAFVRFCEAVQPDYGVHVGDLVDFGSISRFRDSADTRFSAPAQECINAGHRILRDIVQASPKTTWHLMLGNHDERLRNELLSRAERVFGIRPADIPGADREDDALSLRRLLRLDDLHVNLIDDPAGYKHNRIRIGNNFEIRHGMFTGGNPAKKTMDTLQASIAVGHTHAKSTAFKSLFDQDGVCTVLQGAEIGVMSQNNLGYNVRSDWHPGWAVVTRFADDTTNIEHVVFDEHSGRAVWRDQQY